jgi:hypothetical protein
MRRGFPRVSSETPVSAKSLLEAMKLYTISTDPASIQNFPCRCTTSQPVINSSGESLDTVDKPDHPLSKSSDVLGPCH